jgi:hypothetical protein
VSDRVLRFPDRIWDELEGLPNHFGTPPTGQSFTCSMNSPGACRPVSRSRPLPGAYRLYLPSDGLTIWYTVTERSDGQVVVVVQYVKADT